MDIKTLKDLCNRNVEGFSGIGPSLNLPEATLVLINEVERLTNENLRLVEVLVGHKRGIEVICKKMLELMDCIEEASRTDIEYKNVLLAKEKIKTIKEELK